MTTKNKTNKTAAVEPSVIDSSKTYEVIFNEDYDLIKNAVITKHHIAPMAIDIYLQEIEGYYEVLMRNIDTFKAEGYKDAIAELFYRRIASARIAQANMNVDQNLGEDTGPSWSKLYEEAKALRKRILSRLKFICADYPDKKAIVSKISKGTRISDTIQDLFDLGIIGKEMIPELAEMMITEADLERALELGSTLGRRHKSSSIDGSGFSETRTVRDNAITLLYISLKLLRRWARLVYEEDKEMRDLFFSNYLRLKSQKIISGTTEEVLNSEEIEELAHFEEEVSDAGNEEDGELDGEAAEVA